MATLPATATEQRTVVTEAITRRPEKPEGFKSDAARRLSERLNKDNPRSIQQELLQRRPVENPKAQHLIERNIAGTRNPDGTIKRSPDQQTRNEEAHRFNNLAQALVEKGIDKLAPEQQKLAIDQVKGILQRLPEAERLWWGLSVEQINSEVNHLLKDPDFIAKVRELHTERTGEQSLITVDIAAAQAKFEAAKTKKERAQTDLARNNGEREDVTTRLEQFEDRTASGGKKGAKLTELEELEAEAPGLTTKLEETRALYEEAKNKRGVIESTQLQAALKFREGAPDFSQQIDAQRAEAQRLLNEMPSVTNRLNRREILQRERAELLERRGQLEKQRLELQSTDDSVNQEFSQAQAEIETVSRDRQFAEEEFVAGLKNILRDTTFEYLAEKIATAETTLAMMLDEETKQTNDKAEKVFLAGVKSRYVARPQRQRVGGIFGIGAREIWVPGQLKAEVIDADYQKHLETGNPVPLVRSLLESGRDPETGETLTLEEIDAKLADREFTQKWGTRAIEEMLRARFKTGEIPTENEAQIIVDYEWGAATIAGAIGKNKDAQVQEKLEEYKAQTGERDVRKLLAKLPAKNLLALLLMILGSAVAATLSSANLKEALRQTA